MIGLDSETLLNLFYNLVLAILVLFVCIIIAKLAKSAITRANKRLKNFDATLVPILSTSAGYIIYTIGLVIILDIFGVNTASLVALLGTIGLAVGFALKDTLSNIAAGLMLLVLRPFRVGDSIEYGSITGKVIEINLFTTILETADGIFVSSPNGIIWGSTVKNFTKTGKRRMSIMMGISYDDSIDKAFEVLTNLVAKDERILKDPAPQVMLVSLGDSSVNLELRCWANTLDYWSAYWELNKAAKIEIEAAGLSIPFPQRDVHLYSKEVVRN